MTSELDVMLWGRKVGTLVAGKKRYATQICFYFDPDFVRSGWDIAPHRASIYGNVARNGFPVYPESDKLFGGLPSFIADSLPDHWGNTVFREWARQKGIQMNDLSALDRLAYIGRRGMGALEFVPPTSSQLGSLRSRTPIESFPGRNVAALHADGFQRCMRQYRRPQ